MRVGFHIASILVLALLCSGAGTTPPDSPRVASTDTCWRGKDPDRAIVACSRIIDLALPVDSSTAWVFNSRGNAYLDKKDYDHAVKDYEEALRLDPAYRYPHYNRGLAFYGQGKYAAAIADFSWAVAYDSGDVNAVGYRGLAKLDSGDYDSAIDDFNSALRLDPKASWAYYDRGMAFANQRDNDRAIADYDSSIHWEFMALYQCYRELAGSRTHNPTNTCETTREG